MEILQCKKCSQNITYKETEKLKCGHVYCIKCLDDYIKMKLSSTVKCPEETCEFNICDRIIRKIIDEFTIERYDKLQLENNPEIFKCLLPECSYIHWLENVDIQFACRFCSLYNCVQCKACHFSIVCDKYRKASDDAKTKICKEEFERARKIYNEKSAETNRQSIVQAANKILTPNSKVFQCGLCLSLIRKGMGAQLRNCFHCICRDCLCDHIKKTQQIPIPCPFNCKFFLEDSEIREVLEDDDQTIYNKKMLNLAFPNLHKAVYCQSPNCENLIEVYGNVKSWECSKCQSVNCLTCNAIHPTMNCTEYSKINNPLDEMTKKMIERKELMQCPKCKIIISKTSGCNWIKCNICQTELCWILQTYRWGPKGPGDVSGGCKCMVGGKFCHPECIGCIPDNNRGVPLGRCITM